LEVHELLVVAQAQVMEQDEVSELQCVQVCFQEVV
jgi:hypothetical protein